MWWRVKKTKNPEPLIISDQRRLEKELRGIVWEERVILGILIAIFALVVWAIGFTKAKIKSCEPHSADLALVTYILQENPKLTPREANIIADGAGFCSKMSGISIDLIGGLWKNESNFDSGAVSPAGAVGIPQVNSNTWQDATMDPVEGMRSGCRKLIYYHTRERGRMVQTLRSYNSDSPDGIPRGKKYSKEERAKIRLASDEFIRRIFASALAIGKIRDGIKQ
jgi:soluble lytic murein transglycosylase-like protein